MTNKWTLKSNLKKKASKNEIVIPNTGAILEPYLSTISEPHIQIYGISSSEKPKFILNKQLTEDEYENLLIEITNDIRQLAEEFGLKIEEIMKSKGFIKK